MKNTKQKLTLAQEALRLLTHEQSRSEAKVVGTTTPACPNCSDVLQNKRGMQ